MKITMGTSTTARETFDDFLLYCKAKGLAEKTLATYKQHISAIGKHIELSVPIEALVKRDVENMLSSMRETGLAANSIKSYTRTLRAAHAGEGLGIHRFRLDRADLHGVLQNTPRSPQISSNSPKFPKGLDRIYIIACVNLRHFDGNYEAAISAVKFVENSK